MEPKITKVFAYVAIRDGYLGGMFAGNQGKRTAKWAASFISSGFDIVPVFGQEEYDMMTKGRVAWSERHERRSAS